jgi:hypothetical protein
MFNILPQKKKPPLAKLEAREFCPNPGESARAFPTVAE